MMGVAKVMIVLARVELLLLRGNRGSKRKSWMRNLCLEV